MHSLAIVIVILCLPLNCSNVIDNYHILGQYHSASLFQTGLIKQVSAVDLRIAGHDLQLQLGLCCCMTLS